MGNNNKNIAKIDGDGNVQIQDISGSTIIINYNDIEKLNDYISKYNKELETKIDTTIHKEFEQILFILTSVYDLQKNKSKEISNNYKSQRIETLNENINRNYKMLGECEKKRDSLDNPKEKLKHETEITNHRNLIKLYKKELNILSRPIIISVIIDQTTTFFILLIKLSRFLIKLPKKYYLVLIVCLLAFFIFWTFLGKPTTIHLSYKRIDNKNHIEINVRSHSLLFTDSWLSLSNKINFLWMKEYTLVIEDQYKPKQIRIDKSDFIYNIEIERETSFLIIRNSDTIQKINKLIFFN